MPPSPTSTSKSKPDYLRTLDGWRAIGIFGVLLFHDHIRSIGRVSTRIPHELGYLGVSLFFGISGLLITSRILQEEQKLGQFRIGNFYLRRAFASSRQPSSC